MTANCFVIETDRRCAGIVIADGDGFVFHAADPLFHPLDRHYFRSVAAVENACRMHEATNDADRRHRLGDRSRSLSA